MTFDLHTHSTCSDGTTAPAETVALAARAGLAGVALTDHDTTVGWDEAAQACADHGLTFVPGLELSTEVGGRGVHLLGYHVDASHPDLVAECDRLRNERLRRAERMVARLAELGASVDIAAVLAAAGGAPVGRPHVAAAMVAAGIVDDLGAAFDGYLADGGPAYVEKHALHPVEAVALIRRAGGAAVLAHPGLGDREGRVGEALLDALVAAGLAGIEADHAGHDEPTRQAWRAAAVQRGLCVTGSSDFHGTRDDSTVGAATTPGVVADELRARAGQPVPETVGAHREGLSWWVPPSG